MFSIFKNLGEGNTSPKKILLVDGTNTFKRAGYKSSITNDHGVHIGAMGGFLQSIGFAIKTIRPHKVFISFDGHGSNQKRRVIYTEYKMNRQKNKKKVVHTQLFDRIEEEDAALGHQLVRLSTYFDLLPLHTYYAQDVETDDILSYLVNHEFKEFDNYIMTTDSDYYQLIRKNVTIYNPTKKIFIDTNNVKEQLEISANNYLYQKIILGDTSDGIPGIEGLGPKSLQKYFPLLYSDYEIKDLDDLIIQINLLTVKSNAITKLKNSFDVVKRNYELIQLTNLVLPESELNKLRTNLTNNVPQLDTIKFIRETVKDGLNNIIKNPVDWLNECFNLLNLQSKSF